MPTPTRNVTWPELFSDRPAIDYQRVFEQWEPLVLVDYEIAPIGMSAFGAIFFLKRDGTIQCLDPIRGEIRQVGATFDEFRQNMNTEAWQIENLHSMSVAELVARDIRREPNEVYALAPHPNFTGGLSLERSEVLVMDPVVWHSISVQSFGRLELPET